jgi:hypothetical protein
VTYKDNPIGQALYHNGTACKKQWVAVQKAGSEVSDAVKENNSVAKEVFNRYISRGEGRYMGSSIVPDREALYGQSLTCFMKLITWKDEARSGILCDEMKFPCPWRVGEFNNVSDRAGAHALLMCFLQAYTNAMGSAKKTQLELLSPVLNSKVPGKSPNEISLRAKTGFILSDALIYAGDGTHVVAYVRKRSSPVDEQRNPHWFVSTVRECEAVSSVFHIEIDVCATMEEGVDGASVVKHGLQRIICLALLPSEHLGLEDSDTTCRAISLQQHRGAAGAGSAETSGLPAEGGGTEKESPLLNHRQTNAVHLGVDDGMRTLVGAPDVFVRLCALQMGSSKMFLMKLAGAKNDTQPVGSNTPLVKTAGAKNGARPAALPQTPDLISARVLSCHYRTVYMPENRIWYAVMTSRINVVGDESVGHAAATLQLRTVYCAFQGCTSLPYAFDRVYDASYIEKESVGRFSAMKTFTFAPFHAGPRGLFADGNGPTDQMMLALGGDGDGRMRETGGKYGQPRARAAKNGGGGGAAAGGGRNKDPHAKGGAKKHDDMKSDNGAHGGKGGSSSRKKRKENQGTYAEFLQRGPGCLFTGAPNDDDGDVHMKEADDEEDGSDAGILDKRIIRGIKKVYPEAAVDEEHGLDEEILENRSSRIRKVYPEMICRDDKAVDARSMDRELECFNLQAAYDRKVVTAAKAFSRGLEAFIANVAQKKPSATSVQAMGRRIAEERKTGNEMGASSAQTPSSSSLRRKDVEESGDGEGDVADEERAENDGMAGAGSDEGGKENGTSPVDLTPGKKRVHGLTDTDAYPFNSKQGGKENGTSPVDLTPGKKRVHGLTDTDAYPFNSKQSKQQRTKARLAAEAVGFGHAVKGRCLTHGESMKVLLHHGLVGQPMEILHAAIFGQ